MGGAEAVEEVASSAGLAAAMFAVARAKRLLLRRGGCFVWRRFSADLLQRWVASLALRETYSLAAELARARRVCARAQLASASIALACRTRRALVL